MSTVLLAVTTSDVALPDGVTAGNLRFTITGSNGNVLQTQDVADVSATFLNVPAGDYTMSAQRLASTGENLGAAVTGNFSVAATPPVQTYAAPNAISATVTA